MLPVYGGGLPLAWFSLSMMSMLAERGGGTGGGLVWEDALDGRDPCGLHQCKYFHGINVYHSFGYCRMW